MAQSHLRIVGRGDQAGPSCVGQGMLNAPSCVGQVTVSCMVAAVVIFVVSNEELINVASTMQSDSTAAVLHLANSWCRFWAVLGAGINS